MLQMGPKTIDLLQEKGNKTPSKVSGELEGCKVYDDGPAEEQNLFCESDDEDFLDLLAKKTNDSFRSH